MFDRLNSLLLQEGAHFRIIRHHAEGSSAKVAEIRGTSPGQGAKAMLCFIKELPDIFVLAVLPGNRRVDFRKVAQAAGGRKASLVSPEDATALTGCVTGAIPPFSFWPHIRLVVDPQLIESQEEIAFNAGRLDTSIVLNSRDYVRISTPLITSITAA